MEVLRTPDSCFENLAGFPFKPHYVEVPDEYASVLVKWLEDTK